MDVTYHWIGDELLSQICDGCGGTGSAEDSLPCPMCRGRGARLTRSGQRLLRFISTYADDPDIDSDDLD